MSPKLVFIRPFVRLSTAFTLLQFWSTCVTNKKQAKQINKDITYFSMISDFNKKIYLYLKKVSFEKLEKNPDIYFRS